MHVVRIHLQIRSCCTTRAAKQPTLVAAAAAHFYHLCCTFFFSTSRSKLFWKVKKKKRSCRSLAQPCMRGECLACCSTPVTNGCVLLLVSRCHHLQHRPQLCGDVLHEAARSSSAHAKSRDKTPTSSWSRSVFRSRRLCNVQIVAWWDAVWASILNNKGRISRSVTRDQLSQSYCPISGKNVIVLSARRCIIS